ncbi:hypothetical protein [Pontibacter mangrovi]|uniref:Uncharacterized protein n=1 Tax=Pontibacter mangrovi TaxID=2589816 RepID=A0A501W2X1_9BACT|nr:hypothetical protein [Pontibacter mangrovi]TPE43959.1 hypothetical protein FJM65_11075 [Pontibacter mangrovi]
MSLINLKTRYTRVVVTSTGGEYREEFWNFNTATLLVEKTTNEGVPYDDPPPVDTSMPTDQEFYHNCEGTTRVGYFHDGNGGFTTVETANSAECGYVVPAGTFIRNDCNGVNLQQVLADGSGGEMWGDVVEYNSASCGYTPPCDLVPQPPVVNGYSVQLAATTSFPPVLYSVNGGEFKEQSLYEGLEPGNYTVDYKDASPRACTAQNTFEVVPIVDKLYYSRNPFWYQVAAEPGAEVELELLAESEHYKQDFQVVLPQSKVATADGFCHFRLDNILSRLLKAEPPVGSVTYACKKNVLNYYVRYRINGGEWQISYTSTVLLGGMPLENQLSPFGHFLTSHERLKTINKAQPEYLYWISDGTHGQVQIRRGTWLKGVSEPAYTYEVVSVKKHELLCIPAFEPIAEGVDKVDVTVLSPEFVEITESMVYKIAPDVATDERFFLFYNSWGGLDTLRCTGEREDSLDAKEEMGEVDVQPGFMPNQGQRFVFSSDLQRKIKQSTGPNPDWRQEYLQDFVISPARYEWYRNQMLPIVLSRRGLLNSSRKGRQGYTFEYDYAFDLTGYAKSY